MIVSLLAIYCAVIVVASLSGGWLSSHVWMTHLRTQLLMSFVAGLMLGIALLHMLPHAVETLDNPGLAGASTLGGVILMFVLLRVFHGHQHDELVAPEPSVQTITGVHDNGELQEASKASDHVGHGHHNIHDHSLGHTDHASCDHDHHHTHDCEKHLGWLGMVFGMGLHSLMDGVALAASMAAESQHHSWLGLIGLGTFLAVALHKPLDAFAVISVMHRGGWSRTQQKCVNVALSLICPVGAFAFFFGLTQLTSDHTWVGYGLAVSAGFFICIALADLLPELTFHDHDRIKLTAALFLGVALAVGIENLPGHTHQHTSDDNHDHIEHSTDTHDGHEHHSHDHSP